MSFIVKVAGRFVVRCTEHVHVYNVAGVQHSSEMAEAIETMQGHNRKHHS